MVKLHDLDWPRPTPCGVKTGMFDRRLTVMLQMKTPELGSSSLALSPLDKEKEENGGHWGPFLAAPVITAPGKSRKNGSRENMRMCSNSLFWSLPFCLCWPSADARGWAFVPEILSWSLSIMVCQDCFRFQSGAMEQEGVLALFSGPQCLSCPNELAERENENSIEGEAKLFSLYCS